MITETDRVPESDSGSAHWHTAAAMTVPQCGMGRGLTTDERAGTDTLSEACLVAGFHQQTGEYLELLRLLRKISIT